MTVTSAEHGPGLTPDRILKPSPDSWPTFHGDYSGRHYSPLWRDQPGQRQKPVARMDGPLEPDGAGSDRRRQGSRPGAERDTFPNIKATPLLVDGVMYLVRAQPCLCDRCAHGQGNMALLLEEPRRQEHRQPRARHVGPSPLHGHTRSAPGVARRRDRQRAVEPAEGRLPLGRLCDHGADGDSQSRVDGRRRRRPRRARLAGVPRSGNGRAAVEVVRDAAGRRTGYRNLAERLCCRARGRRAVAAGRPTIRT